MWFNLRIQEYNPLPDDHRQPEGTWATYPFLCYSSSEKFEIDSMEAGSIIALPDGEIILVEDTSQEPTDVVYYPERFTKNSLFSCWYCKEPTSVQYAYRWNCGHFICVACSNKSPDKTICGCCRIPVGGLPVVYKAPSYNIGPGSTFDDFAIMFEKVSKHPFGIKLAVALRELGQPRPTMEMRPTSANELNESKPMDSANSFIQRFKKIELYSPDKNPFDQ